MLVKAYRKVQCLSENLPKSAMFEWKLTGKCNMLVKTYRKVQCFNENLPETPIFELKLTGGFLNLAFQPLFNYRKVLYLNKT